MQVKSNSTMKALAQGKIEDVTEEESQRFTVSVDICARHNIHC
jgi:hypothetical protein